MGPKIRRAAKRLPERSPRVFASEKRPGFASRLLRQLCIFLGSRATKTLASTTSFRRWRSASPHFSVIFRAKRRCYVKLGVVHLRAKRKASRPNFPRRPPRNNGCDDFTNLLEM